MNELLEVVALLEVIELDEVIDNTLPPA